MTVGRGGDSGKLNKACSSEEADASSQLLPSRTTDLVQSNHLIFQEKPEIQTFTLNLLNLN